MALTCRCDEFQCPCHKALPLLLAAAQHAIAACPECGDGGIASTDFLEQPCHYCAELRAAVAAAEGA